MAGGAGGVQRRGVQRVDGLEAPLTGRGAEMRAFRELFHASAERRVPRLVVVSGPAGVGKSRLGWEFEKYVDGLADGVWWHRGRCLSYGDGLVYWALAEVIRQRLGIAEDDDAVTVAAKLRDGLARYVGSESDREFIGVRIGRLLGVGADGGDAAWCCLVRSCSLVAGGSSRSWLRCSRWRS